MKQGPSLAMIVSLIFVLLVCAIPEDTRGAPQADADRHQDLKRYEEQTSKEDFETFHTYMSLLRKDWGRTYRQVWRDKQMDVKLREAVDTAVDVRLEATGLWDKIRGIWSKDAIAMILKGAVEGAQKRFTVEYEDFLIDLEEKYSEQMGKRLGEFTRDIRETRREAAASVPGWEALLELSLHRTSAEVQAKYRGPKVPEAIRPGTGKGIVSGAGILVLRSILRKQVFQGFIKRLFGAAGRKFVLVFEGPVGWGIGAGLILYDVYTIGKEINQIPDTIKSQVYRSMRGLFYGKAPLMAWNEGLKEQVKQRLAVTKDLASGDFDATVKELITCASYQTVARELDKPEQEKLLIKLYMLQRGTSMGLCEISNHLARVLPQIGNEHLECVRKALQRLGLELAGKWMHLGPQRICSLMEIPPLRLAGTEPTSENLDLFVWVAGLPKTQRRVALQLDREAVAWIMAQDRMTQSLVLKGHTKAQVIKEIENFKAAAKPKPAKGFFTGWQGGVRIILGPLMAPFLSEDELDLLIKGIAGLMILLVFLVIIGILRRLGIFHLLGWLFRRHPSR